MAITAISSVASLLIPCIPCITANFLLPPINSQLAGAKTKKISRDAGDARDNGKKDVNGRIRGPAI
jgi:hypothetical protein